MKNRNAPLVTSGEQEPLWVTVLGCGAGFILFLMILAM
jgi:hypothetical protein